MKKPIAVGVVGCGYWGPNLLRNFRSLPNCQVKAMCDMNEARLAHLKSLYSDVEGFTEYKHLLNGIDLDAVIVAAPVNHHYPLAKAALLAGKHVLIEKPMASSSAECEELIQLAESRRLTLMVGHTFLYSAAIRRMADIVRAGISATFVISTPSASISVFSKRISMSPGTSRRTIFPLFSASSARRPPR
jgi:predicted dehydrogenase